jgi:hypothetical protein
MMSSRRRHRVAAIALASALLATTAGCTTGTPIDSIVDGLVQQGVDQVTGGLDESIRGLVGDVLGGVELNTDGQVPSTFPADIALTGAVVGGGAGPADSGWVVQTLLEGGLTFVDAAAALEAAGFVASGVADDADGGYGAFTSSAHRVDLSVITDADGVVTATYVVTVR